MKSKDLCNIANLLPYVFISGYVYKKVESAVKMRNFKENPLRVLELFSGIGGMHYALNQTKIILTPEVFDYSVIAAIDISDVANRVYRHNFPKTEHFGSNICGLTSEKLNKWKIEAIFMSPPCQPFTRQGQQKDLKDSRTEPLVHIISLLPKVETLKYILLENVKGFETSAACKMLIDKLNELSYDTKSFLLSPTQLGIPNSRLRYYMIAKRNASVDQSNNTPAQVPDIITDPAQLQDALPIIKDTFLKNNEPNTLQSYLHPNIISDKLLLSSTVLSKYGEVLDIVKPTDSNCCCFTKSYGRYAEGTGSVIQQNGNLDDVYLRAKKCDKGSNEYIEILKELQLRYLHPYEIADLLGFPVRNNDNSTFSQHSFVFPPDYDDRMIHCYRVLGNSLNVKVVAFLSCILFT